MVFTFVHCNSQKFIIFDKLKIVQNCSVQEFDFGLRRFLVTYFESWAERKITFYFYLEPFSYDVVFAEGEKEILKKYDQLNATILFSSEDFCWPDKSLAVSFSIFPFYHTIHYWKKYVARQNQYRYQFVRKSPDKFLLMLESFISKSLSAVKIEWLHGIKYAVHIWF